MFEKAGHALIFKKVGTYVLIHTTISGGVDELLELSNLDPWHGCKLALCINKSSWLIIGNPASNVV